MPSTQCTPLSLDSLYPRAIRSSWILLQELNQIYRPAIKSWRLNERMYVLQLYCNVQLSVVLKHFYIMRFMF